MRLKYLLYILFLGLIFFSKQAAAQISNLSIDKISSTKVSSLSDEQITQLYQAAQAKGMSEDDIVKYLFQNGMPPDQIEQLKNRITLLGLDSKTSKKNSGTAVVGKKTIDFTRAKDDTVIMPKRVNHTKSSSLSDLEVYGASFFYQLDTKFEPNFSVATPKGYILGPGDEVDVLLTGLNEASDEPKISPDGYLKIQYAGLVYLNGVTIEDAYRLIKNKMTKAYPALKSGKTQLTVNLGSTRRIKITIVGEVNTPGSYTISSLSTLYNVLYYSGGPNENGSLRNIEVVRNNKVYKTADFYDFLQHGSLEGNIRLEDQDVIHIPVYKKRVGIGGEVKIPALYELKDNETLEDLINYAGGYTDIAYRGIAKIDQINKLEHEVHDVPANLFSSIIPHSGDLVNIEAVTSRYTNRVVLEGAVYRPDAYELTAGFTLSQLLTEAQGLKPEAYMERGLIKRTLPNLQKTSIPFTPGNIINGKDDIALMREDTVVILDREAFTSKQKVTVEGYVRKPSILTYRKGLTLTDAIALSNGFADEAADHHVTISRIIPNQSDTVADKLVRSFIVNLDSLTGTHQVYELQPNDVISVARLVNYRPLGSVSVRGEVVFPEEYPVQSRNETAIDFLKRAGGVTPYGSLENAQVFRKGIRVNVDLTSASGHDSTTNRKMIMLPGDSIYVPRVISYVQVSGAVNNPQYVSYNGRSFKYYINAAAGVTENALLKGAYIKYPDGLNRPVRYFLFFRTYPAVKPGSKIFVPEKLPESGLKIGLGDLGGIAAALTAIVSIFAIIYK